MPSLSQTATTNLSVLSLALGIVSTGLWCWSFWLEPDRMRVETAKVEAQTVLARELARMTDYLDRRERLAEEVKRLSAENARLRNGSRN